MATNPHPQPDLHDPSDRGTPIIDYVGPGSLKPAPNPSSIQPLPPSGAATDIALIWAKRIAFALVGVLLGATIHSTIILNGYWASLVIVPLIAGIWLGGAYALRRSRSYVQWGVIAVVFATYIISTLGSSSVSKDSLIYLVIAIGSGLLSAFAVIRSFPLWRAACGLMLIAATAVGGWMSQYHFSTTLDEAEYNRITDMHSWGFALSLSAPVLLILLYLWSRNQQPDTPSDSKPQG